MPSPTTAAVGRPVTLHMRDGRQYHGTLQAGPDGLYVLAMSTGQRSFERRAVDRLQVREQALR